MSLSPVVRRSALCALVLFGLVPYVSTVKLPPSATFWAEWIAALLAAAVVISLAPKRQTESAQQVLLPLAALAFVACGLIVLLQLAAHQPRFSGAALLAVAELSLAAIVCSAAARLRESGPVTPALEAWALGLLLALLPNGVAVLVERTGWQVYLDGFVPRQAEGRALGLFGQPNQLAVFSVLAWCAAQYLWMRGRLPGMYLLGIAAVVALVQSGTASRAGSLLLVASTVLGWVALRSHEHKKVGRGLLIGAAALFVVVQMTWALTETAGVAAGTVLRGDTAVRLDFLHAAYQLVALHPLTGIGFGNFAAARWLELSGSLLEPVSGHAHNLIAHLAAEFGVLGALLILVPAAYCALKCLRVSTWRSVTPEQFFVAGVVLVLIGYSLFEYPLWYSYFLLPFAFALGLIEQPSIRLKPVQTEPMNVLRRSAWLLAFAAWGVLAYDYRRIESLYSSATVRQLTASRDPTPLVLETKEVRSIALLTMFDNYAELMLSRTLLSNGQMLADKLPITERAMLAFPNWETVSRHISFLVAAGKNDEALVIWAKTARNAELRNEAYDALQRLAGRSPQFAEFVGKLPNQAARVALP